MKASGFVGAAVVIGLLLPATASAWRIRMQCDGTPSVWEDGIAYMRLHPRWGDPASDWGRAFERTMRAWNEVAGAWPVFEWRRMARLDAFRSGDGQSVAVPVAAHVVDGAFGVTQVQRRLCPRLGLPWPDTGAIIEADVMINAQHRELYPRPVPSCDEYALGDRGASASAAAEDWQFTREATLIHEFGHALGLDHEDNVMTVMMPRNGEGRSCGTPQFAPHPDDVAVMQRLYPDRRVQHDLAASSFEWEATDRIGMTMPRQTVRGCLGQLVTQRWSVANRGTEDVTYDVWWYASETPAFNSPQDRLLKIERGRRIRARQFETHETTVRLSRHLPPGVVHYVGFLIEPAVDHEIHRYNNLSYTATRVELRPEEECR